MKKNIQQKLMKLFILTVMLAGFISFKSFAGGDVYEIYLNSKLVYKQTYKLITGSNQLHFGKLNINDRIIIKYSHCGAVGQSRNIIIKDENNNVIKDWRFTDTKSNQSMMIIAVKELLSLKASSAVFKLYYSAKQLPDGKMLAAITLDDKKLAINNTHSKNSYAFLFALKFIVIPLRFVNT